jgi:hypothetical protein
MNKIEKQIEMLNRPLPMPSLDVNIGLINFPPLSRVLDCLATKTGFGLKSDYGTIIFDPAELVVYDYTNGELTKTICNTEKNFISYLKLAAINYRTFINAHTCIEIVRRRKISEGKLLIVEK